MSHGRHRVKRLRRFFAALRPFGWWRRAGTAALKYDMAAGRLDAAFSGIRNIDRGMAHGVETVTFSDLAVQPDGTFARGGSGTRSQGGFYGPGHAEAAGIFEQSDIVGAFGAKRQ